MTAVALLEMSIRPDAEGVDDILRADLPHSAAFPGTRAPRSLPTRKTYRSCGC